jgi:hypothetical protein
MITRMRWAALPLLLFAAAAVTPGYAVAQPGPPAGGAVLYEVTENLSMNALRGGHRKATSELFGFAAKGTPLCATALVDQADPGASFCAINATGSDNISLATGLGTFTGSFTVVVQPRGFDNPVDSPEIVVAKGKFIGKMDFSPAILGGVPLGSVVGHMTLDGTSKKVPFTGVFRLPFVYQALAGNTPLYLVDPTAFGVPPTFGVAPVAPDEMAIGYPTVRFEITF